MAVVGICGHAGEAVDGSTGFPGWRLRPGLRGNSEEVAREVEEHVDNQLRS